MNPRCSIAPGSDRTKAGYAMRCLIVRNVDESIIRALKVRTTRHGRSVEAEHRALLSEALLPPSRRPLVEVLAAMPSVGRDEDFTR